MNNETSELIFEPYGNSLLIQLDSANETSAGGIYLPGAAQDAPVMGTVLSVGKGLKTGFDGSTIPCMSKVGDRILIMKHAVQKIKMSDGRVLTIIAEGDVYGRFKLKE